MRRKIDHSKGIELIDKLLIINSEVEANEKRYSKIPAYLLEIKNKIKKMKPVAQNGGDVNVYINDIEKYYNEKVSGIRDLLNQYHDVFSQCISELKK
jgi:hypothetical protein